MHHAIRDDRLWFHQHPAAIVRFRASAKGEFDPLTKHGGETPPTFRPSGSQAGAPLNWVAVVDIMQLLGRNSELPNDAWVRIRIQTPAIPLAEHQRAAKQELIEAVAAELLVHTKVSTNRNLNKPGQQNLGNEAPIVIAA